MILAMTAATIKLFSCLIEKLLLHLSLLTAENAGILKNNNGIITKIASNPCIFLSDNDTAIKAINMIDVKYSKTCKNSVLTGILFVLLKMEENSIMNIPTANITNIYGAIRFQIVPTAIIPHINQTQHTSANNIPAKIPIVYLLLSEYHFTKLLIL